MPEWQFGMGEHTEHIRKIGRSVEAAKRIKGEIQSIREEIDALVKESKASRKKKLKPGK
jgi:methyl-accepting chemotaxis protein